MRAVLIAILVSVVGATIWTLISYFYNRLKSPVVVSPRQINLSAQQWDVKSVFNVHNRTQEMIYNIYLKVVIEGSQAKSENIEIGPKTGPAFISANLGNISVNFDFVRINGLDSNGKECLFFILYSLAPKGTESFVMNFKSDGHSDRKPTRIILKIISYSMEPVSLLSKDGIAFPFKLRENFKLRSISLLIKKE